MITDWKMVLYLSRGIGKTLLTMAYLKITR